MATLDIRRRSGYLLGVVIVAHVLLISVQVNTRRGVSVLEAVTFGLLAEVQRGVTSALGATRATWDGYVALKDVGVDNQRLKQQIAQLEVRLQQEQAVASQTRTLQRLLDLRADTNLETTAATIIGASAALEFRTVSIDKGTGDGVRPDMAVIAPAGIVGRVIMPSARVSKVQLLIDRNASAGAIIERSRAQGLVMGTGGDRLRMDYTQGADDIKAGDRVVTSGIDGIYPKGFLIGQIESVHRGAGVFSDVIVRPAVTFSSLEAVLVVLAPVVPSEARDVE
jgi:rod shape-determining protein MreC